MTKLGLPDSIQACLFDLDGVITKTAVVHAAAWKETFDEFLRKRGDGEFRPFDAVADYNQFVDGLPRADGVRAFLGSRGIQLPGGEPDDPPDRETVQGLGNRKNERLLKRIRSGGVEAYEGSLRYIRAVRAGGLRTAVVSSSTNCRDILRAIDAEALFDARIDGVVAAERGLPGKPDPAPFLAAAGTSASRRRPRPCSRTRWRAWRRAGPDTSGTSSASTGWARPTRCGRTAGTPSSPTWPTSPTRSRKHDH